MRKLILLVLPAVLFFACQSGKMKQGTANTPAPSAVVAPENLMALKFDVRGMTCTDCENTINGSIKELPGIADVSSSHTDSFTLVKFDKTKTSADAIKQAIERKGYTVKGFNEVKP